MAAKKKGFCKSSSVSSYSKDRVKLNFKDVSQNARIIFCEKKYLKYLC